jgi:hypothetical protein
VRPRSSTRHGVLEELLPSPIHALLPLLSSVVGHSGGAVRVFVRYTCLMMCVSPVLRDGLAQMRRGRIFSTRKPAISLNDQGVVVSRAKSALFRPRLSFLAEAQPSNFLL